MMVGFLLLFKDKKKSLYLFLLIGIIIPFTVKALCKHSLEVETNLVIDGKEAIFLPGSEVNVKMKYLAGDNSPLLTSENSNVMKIHYSDFEPDESNKEDKNIVSTVDSSYPIYMWFDNGTIYWWSEDKTPSFNEDASSMFYRFCELSDISGLKHIDLTHTKSINSFFAHTSFETLDSLELWNTSFITSMQFVFENNFYLTDMTGIKNWNVENVKEMGSFFSRCFQLETIDLSNWSTLSLEGINGMFNMSPLPNSSMSTSLKKIILSEKFDTSKVIYMIGVFSFNSLIEDYQFLHYFDTSNTLKLDEMFLNNTSLNSLELLKSWDVSKVSSLKRTFAYCTGLESLTGLEDWDVSNVEIFNSTFWGDGNLVDLSAITDWNVSRTANYNKMFFGVSTHPSFSKLEGSWDQNGTFIPSN